MPDLDALRARARGACRTGRASACAGSISRGPSCRRIVGAARRSALVPDAALRARRRAPAASPCRDLAAPPPAAAPRSGDGRARRTGGPGPSARLARSLVLRRASTCPIGIDGVHGAAFSGRGPRGGRRARARARGPRHRAGHARRRARSRSAARSRVDGRVVALHPEHNLALVAYDPALPRRDAGRERPSSARTPLAPGDEIWLVDAHRAPSAAGARVHGRARRRAARFRCRACRASARRTSTWSALTEILPGVGGVLADEKGRVRALWASFSTEGEAARPRSSPASQRTRSATGWARTRASARPRGGRSASSSRRSRSRSARARPPGRARGRARGARARGEARARRAARRSQRARRRRRSASATCSCG